VVRGSRTQDILCVDGTIDADVIQYAQPISKKSKAASGTAATETEETKKSNHVQRVLEQRKKGDYFVIYNTNFSHYPLSESKIDLLLESQFAAGRLYASISSRPGQSGRADGYILEGKELEVGFKNSSVGFSAYSGAVLPQEDKDREAEACIRLCTRLYVRM
jgi:small subunit ribosomal protein S8e